MNLPALPLYVLYFFFYSTVGWLVESIYCSCGERKLINRGFLTGPMCPIYGSGAVALSLCLSPIKRSPIIPEWAEFVLILFLGMIICDFVEFMTSLIMEKMFHARWWDYSNKPFNIQGRICLQHTTYWGLGTVVFMYIIHPPVEKLIAVIPTNIAYITLGIILIVFVIDLINAVRVAADFRKLMDTLHSLTLTAKKHTETAKEMLNKSGKQFANITEELNSKADKLQQQFTEVLSEKIKSMKKARFFRNSPNLKHKAEQEVNKLKSAVEELKKNK